MTIVVVDPAELRRLIGEAVEAAVSRATIPDEWVDARSSPLGRRAFLKLASQGAFPAFRVGNKYMARRRDVDAYVEQQRLRSDSVASRAEAVVSSTNVASGDDPIARAMAAGRLRIVPKSD